ncbi:hypothetical protein QUC31_010184 [Theobroma cacao]
MDKGKPFKFLVKVIHIYAFFPTNASVGFEQPIQPRVSKFRIRKFTSFSLSIKT